MALVIGNKTNDLNNPTGGTSRTFSHVQNTGADGHLVLFIAVPASTLTGVTYNGVSMTQKSYFLTTTTSTHWYIFELDDPATGSNNVVISFSAPVYAPISSEAISFTGCSGTGNSAQVQTTNSPASTSLTVAENSVIIGAAIAGSDTNKDLTIDGSSRTLDWTNVIYNKTWGGLSATGLSAGSISCSVSANSTIAGHFVEMQEATGGAGASYNFLGHNF